jgi:predicted kinase
MAEAVILIGLQGSGKTTYYQTFLAPSHALVSLDVQKTAGRMSALLDECIAGGRSFAVDNVNATRDSRRRYVQAAKSAGYRVVACFFDTPVRTAIGRNNHRKDKKPIPVPAILRTAKHLQRPEPDEGFDEIRVIRPTDQRPGE